MADGYVSMTQPGTKNVRRSSSRRKISISLGTAINGPYLTNDCVAYECVG